MKEKKEFIQKILEFKLYFFEDLYKLLKEYDNELAFYFNKINLNYAALLSDIGRIFILYKFGGIYQDLRIMFKNNKTIFLIKKYLENGISLILEENGQSIRIGNLASKKKL